MHVDRSRDRAAISRRHSSHVVGDGSRGIDTTPSQELGPPRYIRILAVDEEIGIEKTTLHRNIVNHAPSKEGRGGTCPEYILHVLEALHIGFVPAAVEVTHCGSKKDSGGIDSG